MAVIYRITNMANGKYYIGSAESYERRRWQHIYDLKRGVHKNPRLQAAWNKYGEEMFVFEVLETVPAGDSVFDVENRYLHEHVGRPDCYNINIDAHKPRLGKTHSEETKAKIRANRTPPAGENHYRYGKTVPDEVRAKISATQLGRPSPRKGVPMSEQARANIAAAAKRGEEAHFYGKQHTEEAKSKMRRPVVAFAPDGSRHEFDGVQLAGDELGVPYTMLVRLMRDKTPAAKGKLQGWFFAYADEPIEMPATPEIPDEYAHLPRTRQQAKEQGAREYFTGVPCTRGHIAPRKTKGSCTACMKEDAPKEYAKRAAKPATEAAKAAGRRYYERNRDAILAKQRKK